MLVLQSTESIAEKGMNISWIRHSALADEFIKRLDPLIDRINKKTLKSQGDVFVLEAYKRAVKMKIVPIEE